MNLSSVNLPHTQHLPRRQAVRSLLALAGALGLGAASRAVFAQTWPAKPVRIVVPFPAGGSTDILARQLAKKFEESLGQGFVVENRAGANGNLGAAAVASAAPDGYTLLFTTTGPLVFNKFIYKSTPFDPSRDFTPVVKAADMPLLVASNPALPVKSLAELVAYAKNNPGQVSYSTGGNGSMGHLTAELLQRRAGIRLTHVPYKGSAPALNDLLAGVVNLSFDLLPTYAQHVQSGKIRALAVTTLDRSALMPDIATLAEQGMMDFEVTGWNALVGPAGLPADVVQKLNSIVNQYLVSEAGREAIRSLGMQPAGGTPQQLVAYMASQSRLWQPIASSVSVE